MTRSGRITNDNLRTRDPQFVASTERWFASQSNDKNVSRVIAPPALFTSFQLGSMTLANRIVVAEQPGLVAADGVPGDAHAEHYRALAAGQPGAIITAPLAVSPEGRITPEDAGLYNDRAVQSWAKIVTDVHALSSILVIARLSPRAAAARRDLADTASTSL